MANNAISETDLRQRVLSTNRALSSTLSRLQSQNRALQSQNRAMKEENEQLSSAVSRMESRLNLKRRRARESRIVKEPLKNPIE